MSNKTSTSGTVGQGKVRTQRLIRVHLAMVTPEGDQQMYWGITTPAFGLQRHIKPNLTKFHKSLRTQSDTRYRIKYTSNVVVTKKKIDLESLIECTTKPDFDFN